MKSIRRFVPLTTVLLCSIPLVHAQAGFDVGVGFGAAQDKATGTGLDANFNTCAVNVSGCAATGKLGSFMMGVQGNLILWKHFGVGAEVNFQPGKAGFVTFPQSVVNAGGYNLQSRTTLYDFNGVVQPFKSKRAALQILGGAGGANLKFYASGSVTDSVIGTQNFSQFYGSSNHFQVHGGIGVNIYFSEHAFIRPQFDVHYVNNLTQFGNNVITRESIWIGYTFGQ